jgi:hypothetical protein
MKALSAKQQEELNDYAEYHAAFGALNVALIEYRDAKLHDRTSQPMEAKAASAIRLNEQRMTVKTCLDRFNDITKKLAVAV